MLTLSLEMSRQDRWGQAYQLGRLGQARVHQSAYQGLESAGISCRGYEARLYTQHIEVEIWTFAYEDNNDARDYALTNTLGSYNHLILMAMATASADVPPTSHCRRVSESDVPKMKLRLHTRHSPSQVDTQRVPLPDLQRRLVANRR